jgi:3-oxoacyl-[acyl-carrier-protein] synthase II
MADRRVVITGLGAACAAGVGIEQFWQSLLDGRQCIRRIDLFDPGKFPSQIGGQISDFSARKFVPKDYRKAVKVMARDIEIAVAAADLAVRDSGLVTRGMEGEMTVDPKRLGCNVGAGLICTDLNELGSAVNTAVVDGKFDFKVWGSTGMENLTPLWLLKYLPNMLSCHVTIIHDAEGPSNAITCGDTSAHLSIGEAGRWIARGDADVVIAGGAESKVNPMALLRQTLLKRACTSGNDDPGSACRPFDAAHDGTAIGEGGGLLVLEELQHARSRGVRIYAELVGFGAACDPAGFDVTKPNAGSLDRAAKKAIDEAGIQPSDISLVVTHGTGVPGEDLCEVRAWEEVFARCERISALALTGAIGSLFAGAGGVETAATVMALHTQTVPPTVNFKTAAHAGRLSFCQRPKHAELEYAITSAFSVGGQSAACVLKRYQA